MSTPVRRWRFPATSQYIAHARYVVAAHARWLGADEASVALAVSEAFTSAVVHAAPNAGHPGDVEVIVVRHPDALEVCVCDDAPCAEHDNGNGNGGEMDAELGMRMIERVTTALELTHGPQGGTQVRMSFPVSGAG